MKKTITLLITMLMLLTPMKANANGYGTGWQQSGSDWYYRTCDGTIIRNSWLRDGDAYYYMDKAGRMVRSTMIEMGPDKYYINKYGKMARSAWVNHEGKWYYSMEDGKILRNSFLNMPGGKVYFATSEGWIYTDGWYNINLNYYLFDKSGCLVKEAEDYNAVGVVGSLR